MLLPQTKEREYRFKLALRMGLPIFALITALISHTLITNYKTLQTSFYIEALLLIIFSIYFIFYLIYNGFKVKITDDVSKTFTREYFNEYIIKEIENSKEYTLLLVSIDNLNDINNLYGIKNGDKVLREVAKWVGKYLVNEGIVNFPMGHIKGGEFIIGLNGPKERYMTIMELISLRSAELTIDNIEVKISTALTDTSYSREIDYLTENLFEHLERNKNTKLVSSDDEISPNELESLVIHAINNRNIIIMSQNIYEGEKVAFKECFIKLKSSNEKVIFPKTYLKIINKLGLGMEFDLMVLEELIENCKGDEYYAINILPTSLRNENFLLQAKELLKNSKKNIIFVISEMEYYSHLSRFNSIISSLKEYGAMIAIDRLGSIHTSFLYLRELDIDIVRFDTYYSRKDKLEKNRSIIEGFNTMVHEKNLKSWIKNIGDKESYHLAKSIDIDYIQGKYMGELENVYES